MDNLETRDQRTGNNKTKLGIKALDVGKKQRIKSFLYRPHIIAHRTRQGHLSVLTGQIDLGIKVLL